MTQFIKKIELFCVFQVFFYLYKKSWIIYILKISVLTFSKTLND